jgi:midasin (ATPase involved in ribosome maturation)
MLTTVTPRHTLDCAQQRGEFEWPPGAFTQAVQSGKCVPPEDVNFIPVEIQVALVQLLELRCLAIGNGELEQYHPDFCLFGTMSTRTSSRYKGRLAGQRVLHPSL